MSVAVDESLRAKPRTTTAVIAIFVTLGLHFTWEMLQAPMFAPFAGSVWTGTIRCFQAALGDLLLASGAYVVTAFVFRRPMWLVQGERWLTPAATWIAVGLLGTVVFERWAIESGRWRYGSDMPTLLGIGLLPLLQWLIVPALTVIAVRSFARPSEEAE